MSDLSEFLLARIAEDEDIAREVAEWQAEDALAEPQRDPVEAWGDSDWGDYTVRFTPARVLAECEAKRRIVEAWVAAEADAGEYPGTEAGYAGGLDDAAHFLALPYADHPDYRPEWRP